jgi:hypothetical protein
MMLVNSRPSRLYILIAAIGLPSAASAAVPVSVTIKDGGDAPRTLVNCGDLKELTTDATSVTLWTTGTCSVAGGTGVDTPTAVAIGYGDVNENSTVTIDVNNYPVVVTNPSSVTVTSAVPSIGTTADISLSGSKIIWSVPEVSQDMPNITISYTIDDASDGVPSSNDITVNVIDGTAPGGSCVATGNIVCKGALDWPAGTNFGPNIATSSDFEIWEFTYTAGKGSGSFQYAKVGGYPDPYTRRVVISEFPDETMDNPVAGYNYCARATWGALSSLSFGKAGQNQYYECPLVEGTHYYLKMQIIEPSVNDRYILTTY